MAAILSWKKAKPGTMLGGKGVLIPYTPERRQGTEPLSPEPENTEARKTDCADANVIHKTKGDS